ncbi:uncharacterized protein LOC134017459 isoform X1 [Osmerus eperlanus]|uniref:uncharacterized protein LOC134017459 isoform X1 n=1 Tax=Osmerus eperlanus TaxID=29151 RepID=UPI002E123C51
MNIWFGTSDCIQDPITVSAVLTFLQRHSFIRTEKIGNMEDIYPYTRSPAWEELEPEKGPTSAAGIHAHVVGAVGGSGAVDESSDSEGEQEGPQKLIRKVSTSGQIRSKTSVKEGLLLKQTSSFQRWKKRYFKLRGRTLYYAKDAKTGSALARWQERALRGVSRSRVCWRVLSVCWTGPRRAPPPLGASGSEEGLVTMRSLIFDEVDLSDASVAESSTKNVNNSFTVSSY